MVDGGEGSSQSFVGNPFDGLIPRYPLLAISFGGNIVSCFREEFFVNAL